jgi:hypothetical protein
MRRRCMYLVLIVGIAAGTGAARLSGVPAGNETPLWIEVNAADEAQPDDFAVAVGDVIEFSAQPQIQPVPYVGPGVIGAPSPYPTNPERNSTVSDLTLRIQGENGVLADLSVVRHASFQNGALQIHGGPHGRSVKAMKAGKVTVEVTTHRGATRREIREFTIRVATKRETPVKPSERGDGPANVPPA